MYSCLPVGNAGQGDAAGVGDRREHVGGGLDVGVSVLHVDGQPGKPCPRHEPGARDASQRQPGSDLWFPGTQRSFDRILFQRQFLASEHSKMTITRETSPTNEFRTSSAGGASSCWRRNKMSGRRLRAIEDVLLLR